MAKKIIFIHGRATKPNEEPLKQLWYDAVSYGLQRDFGDTASEAFKKATKEFVYYGDLSNTFLHQHNNEQIPDEVESRQAALKDLQKYKKDDFNKPVYNHLKQNSDMKEMLADTFSGILSILRMGRPLVSAVAPDMGNYWNKEAYFGSDIRHRLTEVLKTAFDNDDEIMLVSHSLGTIVSYDNLWKFSHYGEYRKEYGDKKKVDLFVTFGSPLGDENVKQHLKGSVSKGVFRYPHNIRQWVNLAAEDDYISHDSRLKDDFNEMYTLGLLEKPITDIHPIYNLTVRKNSPNPHASTGYLIHPKFINVLWNWMSKD